MVKVQIDTSTSVNHVCALLAMYSWIAELLVLYFGHWNCWQPHRKACFSSELLHDRIILRINPQVCVESVCM